MVQPFLRIVQQLGSWTVQIKLVSGPDVVVSPRVSTGQDSNAVSAIYHPLMMLCIVGIAQSISLFVLGRCLRYACCDHLPRISRQITLSEDTLLATRK